MSNSINKLQITNKLMDKMLIKKAVGEGVDISEIIETYGEKETVKVLLDIIRESSSKTTEFYSKCLRIMIELEPKSREEYPELWV